MTGRKNWIGGNWKCNGSINSCTSLVETLSTKSSHSASDVDVIVFPTSLHIPMVFEKLNKSIKVGMQNISATGNGAYTGEISIEMAMDFGIEWTLIGHSERRQYYGETDVVVAKKVEMCQAKGINATVCIGEVLSERQAGKADEVCRSQLEAFIPFISDWTKIVIAYEPVWAIGTGEVATPQQAQDAHEVIRNVIAKKTSTAISSALRIVYGGSVNSNNCKAIISQPDVDGFLVGGASLKTEFVDIINCCGIRA